MAEHYGFDPSVSAVREAVLHHAQRVSKQLDAGLAQTFRSLPAQGAAQIIAEADGTMICTVAPGRPRKAKRPRSWNEMRLVAAVAQGKVQPTYGAGFSSVEETGRRWGHCAKKAGWGLQSQIHVVADGAEWIRKQSVETFGAQQTFLLDIYHLNEYLAQAAPACRPAKADHWRRVQHKRLLRGASTKVLADLKPFLEPDSMPDESSPVRGAYRYLSNRADALDYPRAIALELPIGSGMIESGHRHVLQKRLKQPGTAWLPQNAHFMAQLRVVRANGEWANLWN